MNWQWLRCFVCRAALLALLVALVGVAMAPAARPQDGAAGKSPEQAAPKKDSTDQTPGAGEFVIISNPINVTTPVTVFDSGGQFVYDLEKNEFKIYDNGQLQEITQFDSEMRRLSLVIVVETNDTTAPFLDSVRPLGSMFSEAVMGPQGEVAVLTYSDRVNLALDFTSNGDRLDTVLRGLQGRGGGMHSNDAINRALSMLASPNRPKDSRKVIIDFSDGFDIGSKISYGEILKGAMNSNITIYHLGFSPLKGLWKRPAKDPQPDLVAESVARPMGPNMAPTPTNQENIWDTADINIIGILLGIGEQVKKPIFKDSMTHFARYSGGQSYQKWGKDTVQATLNNIATEIHSQYELAYAPPKPIAVGLHTIKVEVRRPGAKVRSRAGWFYQGEPPRGVKVR
ncbi:MAG: VWA domain-containing protein [Terriglobia bacterium]|jgi:VWFA-related protein